MALVKQLDGVTLIGTSHVSKESISTVRETIESVDPDVVAIELGPRRYTKPTRGKISVDADIDVHLRTRLFLPLIQKVQSRAAEERGTEENTDMEEAIEAAQSTESDVALIDRDILKTFGEYWRNSGIVESMRLISSIGLALARGHSSILNVKENQKDIQQEVNDYLSITERKFPSFKQEFIIERDEEMAGRIQNIREKSDSTVVVVGAAHIPGILSELQDKSTSEIKTPLLNPSPTSINS